MSFVKRFFNGNANAAAVGQSTTQGNAGCSQMTTAGSTFQLPQGAQGQAGNTLNIGGITTATWTTNNISMGPPLSSEESKELEELKAQHAMDIKSAKIAEFKKLPPELRQFIVNVLTWNDESSKIDNITADKSARLVELEQKQNNSGQLYINSNGIQWANHNHITIANIPPNIPDGLSAEDLKNAHTEITLEEHMLEEND